MTRPLLTNADRTDVFRGLAHPLRRRVLGMLGRGERSVSELLSGLDVTMPSLSRHLAILRDAGLVTQRVAGRRRYYRRNGPALRRARRWLQQNT